MMMSSSEFKQGLHNYRVLDFEITKFERCRDVTSTSVIQIPATPAPIIPKDVK